MTGTEKQIAYAFKLRADAVNQLMPFIQAHKNSDSFYGKNLYAIYNAGRNIIMGFEDAHEAIENSAAVAKEVMEFAHKWKGHYNFRKQHGQKPYSAVAVLKYYDAAGASLGLRFLTAAELEKALESGDQSTEKTIVKKIVDGSNFEHFLDLEWDYFVDAIGLDEWNASTEKQKNDNMKLLAQDVAVVMWRMVHNHSSKD